VTRSARVAVDIAIELAVVVALGLTTAACQDNVATPFPPGLEPLEDNEVADVAGYDEVLRTVMLDASEIRIHGRGFIHVSPGVLWSLMKMPDAMVARCSTDERMVQPGNEPDYEHSFLVHYIVRDILTVEWDDQWRYGVIAGTVDAPRFGMVRHQKVQGSDFIYSSEGTIQLLATDDPQVSELAFVEHLDAISGSAADVTRGMQDNYHRLRALARGAPDPGCP
jgi:hypothetical protein